MEEEQRKLLDEITKESSLTKVQEYIKKVNTIRGFEDQQIEKRILLFIEEVGELAKAIRKEDTDIAIDMEKKQNYTNVEEELADVFYVLCCIANCLNFNLYECLNKKEEKNITRKWGK